MPESCQDKSSSVVNGCNPRQDTQQDTAEDEVSSSDSPQTKHHSAGVDRLTDQSTVTCSTDGVVKDPEVIYDDVPAESLQHPVKGDQFVTLVNLDSIKHFGLYSLNRFTKTIEAVTRSNCII